MSWRRQLLVGPVRQGPSPFDHFAHALRCRAWESLPDAVSDGRSPVIGLGHASSYVRKGPKAVARSGLPPKSSWRSRQPLATRLTCRFITDGDVQWPTPRDAT